MLPPWWYPTLKTNFQCFSLFCSTYNIIRKNNFIVVGRFKVIARSWFVYLLRGSSNTRIIHMVVGGPRGTNNLSNGVYENRWGSNNSVYVSPFPLSIFYDFLFEKFNVPMFRIIFLFHLYFYYEKNFNMKKFDSQITMLLICYCFSILRLLFQVIVIQSNLFLEQRGISSIQSQD